MINTLWKNETLKEMLIGILLGGVILIGCFFMFSKTPVYYSVGLLFGIAGAVFMACHMAITIEDAVLLNEKDAISYIRKMTYIRYGVACILVVLVGVTNIGSAVFSVFGLLLLKMGAYMQPLVHRILKGKEDNFFTAEENQVIMEEAQSNLSSDSDNDSDNTIIKTQGGE